MNYRTAVLADRPLGYWPLHDVSGSAVAADLSGYGRPLTISGGVTLNAPGPVRDASGCAGMLLDGSTGSLVAPSALVLPTSAFSLEVWCTLSTLGGATYARVLSTDEPAASPFRGTNLGVRSDGGWLFGWVGNGTTSVQAAGGTSILAGAPLHLVLTYDGTTLLLYQNGLPAFRQSFAGPMAAGRGVLTVGCTSAVAGAANYFGGTVQHVAAYGTALSAARVQAHYSAALASDASPYVLKQQLVLVYSPTGGFLDVWRDAPLLAGVKFAVNSATTPLRIQLPRRFDDFDEAGMGSNRGTIGQGNIVQYYVFGPGLPTNGLLKFQGVIDSYQPQIAESGEESVTVSLTPYDSVAGDRGIVGGLSFGTAGVPATYVDTVSMFTAWFTTTDPIAGQPYAAPLTLDPANPASSGNASAYTFQNQKLSSIWGTVLRMLPANWFWRINPDKTVTLNVPPLTAQHQFVLGQHIVAPQYSKDWNKLRNIVQVEGTGLKTQLTSALVSGTAYTTLAVESLPVAVVAGQQLVLNLNGSPTQTVTLSVAAAMGATSVSVTSFTANASYGVGIQVTLLVRATRQGTDLATFGARLAQVVDNRVVDQGTADVIAQSLLAHLDRMLLRTKIRVVDYRGDAQVGIGYDIETIKPGDTCSILNPFNNAALTLWDAAVWDTAVWDYAAGAVLAQTAIIYAVSYHWDYVDLELGYYAPSQDRELLSIQTALADYTLGG